ncbi:MAG: HigA family addiction module antidote protein [Alphaproteobacteria bacterium]|nr:HigA family addiction module antidote protein [Alphaproteobacteria bacterium]
MLKSKRRPTPPGMMLREMYLKPRRVSVARFAAAVGCSRKHMSEIVNGRTRLEPDMAARIARVLGTSIRLWINLQANLDAYDAERAARKWKPATVFRARAA